MKCNSRPEILNVMASLGCHFECASQSEIEYVLTKLKTKPENIIFANPVKPVSHLKFVANNKVPKMTFDSEYELAKIAEYYPDADVVLRLRCDDELADFSLGVKFGCDPETGNLQPVILNCVFFFGKITIDYCFFFLSDYDCQLYFSCRIDRKKQLTVVS